ncbi:hypothetical protein MATL_G00092530 [Megalops atlanticus]|uniref:Uncharacterized protein n=1 Tax=Megalops atlanticus TaxID=7932 RepID=A0A9D3Q5P0_MEGAT|nr:hypothetical protein MATL_G00092530 [Megalops atlanticus]
MVIFTIPAKKLIHSRTNRAPPAKESRVGRHPADTARSRRRSDYTASGSRSRKIQHEGKQSCFHLSRTSRPSPSSPWLTDSLRSDRTALRAAERKWRKSRSSNDLASYHSLLTAFTAATTAEDFKAHFEKKSVSAQTSGSPPVRVQARALNRNGTPGGDRDPPRSQSLRPVFGPHPPRPLRCI